MSAVLAATAAKFLRKTTLRDTEANTNFRMLDDDVAEAITSAAADEVTPLMSKVYTRLLLTPAEWREGERVLRFAGQEREGKWVTAWEQLRCHLRVSGETASKALRWMHGQGIIGYYSGKNGVGIRIFLNRAANSVARRRGAAPQKFLSLAPASDGPPRTSPGATPFNDSFAVSEILETELNPRAPTNGAESNPVCKTSSAPSRQPTLAICPTHNREAGGQATARPPAAAVPVEEIVERLRSRLEPCVREAAARSAAQSASREMERTREWFETKALPKAVRVAQRETYDLLRKHGAVDGRRGRGSAALEVGRGVEDYTAAAARPLTPEEVRETAEVCIALLETQGKSIEVTLSELSSEGGGGWLLPEDAQRVREAVRELAPS